MNNGGEQLCALNQDALEPGHHGRIAGIGYFEPEKKDYKKIPLEEQVEVLSMVGDVATQKGEPKIDAHVVLGNSEGHTRGGHLVKAYVRPTLELIITESPKRLQREHHESSGLPLIRL